MEFGSLDPISDKGGDKTFQRAKNSDALKLQNMHITSFPEIGVFQTLIEILKSRDDTGKVVVTYSPPSTSDTDTVVQPKSESIDTQTEESKSKPKRLKILPHATHRKKLKSFTVIMYQSPTTG